MYYFDSRLLYLCRFLASDLETRYRKVRKKERKKERKKIERREGRKEETAECNLYMKPNMIKERGERDEGTSKVIP